jgi:hypothetical protein
VSHCLTTLTMPAYGENHGLENIHLQVGTTIRVSELRSLVAARDVVGSASQVY